jgi:endonuclease YncB( thermonuclease family)
MEMATIRHHTAAGAALLILVLGNWAAVAETGERSLALAACPNRGGGEPVKLAEALSGDTLRLADGRVIRLAGIDAPRVPIGTSVAEADTLAATARDRVATLFGSAELRLMESQQAADRHGRIHGEIVLSDGRSMQAALVAEGLARVHPFVDETICLEPLFTAERAARNVQKGIWASHEYAIWKADDASLIGQNGLYQLVEGRVVSVGAGSRQVFVDFGRDWGRDFTVMLTASLAADLAKTATPIASLVRHRVRVRGVIEERSGPAIRVESSAAIELLDGN